jgi:hypothetical protein
MFGSLISMTLGLDTATQVSKIIKLYHPLYTL